MAVMDEFREERKSVKEGTFKEKFQYFWDYYRWTTFWVIIGVVSMVSLSVDILSKEDFAVYAVFVNCFSTSDESKEKFGDDFIEAAGLSAEDYDVIIETSLRLNRNPDPTNESEYENNNNAFDALVSLATARELDVFTSDLDVYELYAYSDWFYDLRELLSAEQLERYSPYFYYVDKAVLTMIHEASADNDQLISMPDPSKPDTMQEPIPVGILLSDRILPETFFDYFLYKDISDVERFQELTEQKYLAVFGIPLSSDRTDAAVALLEYMTGNPVPQLNTVEAE